MVSTGHLQRIELERAKACDDLHDRPGLSGKRTRRRQQVVVHEVAPRGTRGDVAGRVGHPRIVRVNT
jgi:hypothetical protein